ncbi:mitochondrial thiamine pyrophosphate carrier-like [Achroia grisella]|uniref:mitochondrial thiamine pyrophosphate carrier-like n=1 Tax=Achroia grisella TaxID=688607 RepID=UPI0027D322AA|nr:mitochondrial thiamine pyrophosphate carrier-like [Achroia grisella]
MTKLLNNNADKISIYQSALAGGASGAVTRAMAQPLDVLKIRFQLQLEPIKCGSKYSSIFQAVTSIIKEEGVTTLWSGHVPAQYLSILFGVLQFSTFEKLSRLCQKSDPEFYMVHKHWINFCNGGIAATVATVASYPFDTVRTRLIAERKTSKAYRGFSHAFTTMIKHEGPRSLFKGLLPTLGPVAPQTGIQFAVYKLLTESVMNKIVFFQRHEKSILGAVESTLLANLIAGSISGLVAKTAMYPFDLVKKRLQIQGFQQHRISFGRQMYCGGMMECLKLTIMEEGFLALYKGYAPSMIKSVVTTALHFAVYDEIKHFFMRVQT